ncbi:STIMA regulator, partial [Amia calva]|nr:STIMA regulator [Amia calva]
MTDLTKAKPQGCDNGALLDRFGVLIQALLAVVAFSTLMLKRFREPKGVRRPWRIWFYDTSKQAIGALFIHFANVFLSNLTEQDPCSLYLMNFLLDATLGMLLIWLAVKVISRIVEYKQYTLLMFGEYGDPPQAAAWIGQCAVYMLIMVFEKTVVSLVLLIPGWTKLQEVLLDYIPNPQLELVLVMLIVPFIVNPLLTLSSPRISSCLSAISAWMHSHHLKLNLSKSDLLFFPHSSSPSADLPISIHLESTTLSPSSSAKNLGVTLDPALSFSQHITMLTHTCRFFLSNIRQIRPFLTDNSTQLLVQSLVLSHLHYSTTPLLQLPPGRPACIHYPPTPAHPELCSSSGILSATIRTRYSTAPLPPLAPDSGTHSVQDFDPHLPLS